MLAKPEVCDLWENKNAKRWIGMIENQGKFLTRGNCKPGEIETHEGFKSHESKAS